MNTGYASEYYTTWKNKQLFFKAADYTLITGQLYNFGPDEILRRCVFDHERKRVMDEVHAGVSGGHYAGKATVCKIL